MKSEKKKIKLKKDLAANLTKKNQEENNRDKHRPGHPGMSVTCF